MGIYYYPKQVKSGAILYHVLREPPTGHLGKCNTMWLRRYTATEWVNFIAIHSAI